MFLAKKKDRLDDIYQSAVELLDSNRSVPQALGLDLSLAFYELAFSIKIDLDMNHQYVNNVKETRRFLKENMALTDKMDNALRAGKKLYILFIKAAGGVDTEEALKTLEMKAAVYKIEIEEFVKAEQATERGDLFSMCRNSSFSHWVSFGLSKGPAIPLALKSA